MPSDKPEQTRLQTRAMMLDALESAVADSIPDDFVIDRRGHGLGDPYWRHRYAHGQEPTRRKEIASV